MSLAFDDSSFPAPVLVPLSTLSGGAVYRYNGIYHQKSTVTPAASHNLHTGDAITLAGSTLVERVAATLKVVAPPALPVAP